MKITKLRAFISNFIKAHNEKKVRIRNYNNMLDRTRCAMENSCPEEYLEDELVQVGHGLKVRKGDLQTK